MMAVIGSLKRFWERYKEENPTLQVSVPFVGGFSANIPLAEKGKIKSTRKGIDTSDKSTPFVQTSSHLLIKFYSKYEGGKEYKFCRSPYAETIPLRKGDKGFSYGNDVNNLKVVVIESKYNPPDHLRMHCEQALTLFKKIGKIRRDGETGKWENNNSVRISNIDLKENTIYIQRATYFDQIGTNITLDWASGYLGDDDTLTIRNDIESHDRNSLPKLNHSVLANTLGVAVVILNPDSKEVLIPVRGNEQAIMAEGKGQFHCSASGVFEWADGVYDSGPMKFDFFMRGMEREIESEIGLTNEQYELIPLAFSRELVRGGKPQLFFVAETTLDISDIKSKMKLAEESWEFIHESDIPSDSPLSEFVKTPLDAPQDMFTYEGWMALKVAMAYFYKIEPPFPTC